MDILQDYLPAAFYFYNQYYTPYEPYLRPFRRYFYLAQYYSFRYVFPYLWPAYKLLGRLISKATSDAPDLATLALLAFILFMSLKLLNMLRRQIMYWISLGLRLALWTGIGLVGFYVYQRGLDQSLEDLAGLLSFLAQLGDEGEKIGQTKAKRKAAEARRAGSGPRGRTRGGGWS
ncbi:MAG: hypothetical protein Q9187_006809 [Circinaria calcarea]